MSRISYFSSSSGGGGGGTPTPILVGEEGSSYVNGCSGTVTWYEHAGRLWIDGRVDTPAEPEDTTIFKLPYSGIVAGGIALSSTMDPLFIADILEPEVVTGVVMIGVPDLEPEQSYYLQLSALLP